MEDKNKNAEALRNEPAYEPPKIEYLGSLTMLIKGNTGAFADKRGGGMHS